MGTDCFWWHILVAIRTECWLSLKFVPTGGGREEGEQKENDSPSSSFFNLMTFLKVLTISATKVLF